MRNKEYRADKLREAIALLMDAKNCVESAMGKSDATEMTCSEIQGIIDDLRMDVIELETL